MLCNCIWESSLRKQLFFFNAAEGRGLIPIRVKHSERGWHSTQGPEVMLLFCYLCFFTGCITMLLCSILLLSQGCEDATR